jgi:hypothetical protein
MKARWVVAKYIPDLRRNEPVNIGVILEAGGEIVARFRGERADGRIDGRRIGEISSAENYKNWIAYWRGSIVDDQIPLDSLVNLSAGDENYFLEQSGSRLIGDDESSPDEMLDRLYADLVDPHGAPTVRYVSAKRSSERVFKGLGIWEAVTTSYRANITVPDGPADSTSFDYSYRNGKLHLMKAIAVSEESTEAVHAASWGYEKARESIDPVVRGSSLISLVLVRDPEAAATQIDLLRSQSRVIALDDEDDAEAALARVFGLSRDSA